MLYPFPNDVTWKEQFVIYGSILRLQNKSLRYIKKIRTLE